MTTPSQVARPEIWTIPFEDASLEPWIETANSLLTEKVGSPCHILPKVMFASKWGPKPQVVRCSVKSPDADLQTLFIRRSGRNPFDPEDERQSGPTYQLYDYWAGAAFGPRNGPAFYGGSRDGGFILLEDLGDDVSLVDALFRDDQKVAKTELNDLAECLGTMHAETFGRESEYLKIRDALLPNKAQVSACDAKNIRSSIDELKATVASLGIDISNSAEADIETIADLLDNPGDFLTFIHRDPIPSNFIRTGGKMRILDFEFSGYGHALTDIATFRMGMPTNGQPGRLPQEMIDLIESRHRSQLEDSSEFTADDSAYDRALVLACGWWMMMELIRNLGQAAEDNIPEDQHPKVAARRSWITTRLIAFIDIAESRGYARELLGLSEQLLDRLSLRWGEEAQPLDYFPVFNQI
jgi:thiamine kinase-like enzyme